uniref:cyclic AMP-dependent transcription factor ATF-7-like isoform X3 n=1 Tax=Styela clava TaxID=7725 RepID=UPI0019395A51|nr:cyclic AMP-dependent transcription factor ATF-7-like isoform X3 [Styela clava]
MSSSVISSPSPPVSDKNERRSQSPRITCTAHGCNQSFSSASELAIHKQKHQMTLKLGPSRTGLADMLPFDQTPTPTKFLQYGKETGLFDEISNPFDNEFKRNTTPGHSLKEKARRSAVPGLIINNQKAKTPTSFSVSNHIGLAPVAQPVHVITLTPTLPSPVGALSGAPFFIPPLPSPQTFLPSPAALISPSIVPFSAPGLPFPNMQAVVEAQQAAITQAFINAAVANSNNNQQHLHQHQQHHQPVSQPHEESNAPNQSHMVASRTSSMTDLPENDVNPFPTHTVSVPVHNNPTPPSCHALQVGQNMAAAPVGSASVIQQHSQMNMEPQRRALTQSNSMDHQQNHHNVMSANLERKPSFPGETSVITQAPANSSTALQMNPNMNMHNANSVGYQYNMSPYTHTDVTRVSSHPVLTLSRSVPTPHNNNQNHSQLPHQNSLPNIDAKQKLKETLTSNNPNLQVEHSSMSFQIKEEDRSQHLKSTENEELFGYLSDQNEVSSSSIIDGGVSKTGRRRGRQTALDPDQKRMRFLERNRAAASRCRAKKKQWVNGLESKAKELCSSNVNLQNEVANLREEVAKLKQLLLAHRDCPITRIQQQKLVSAGGDPTAVVTNPAQAAASLLGLSQEDGNSESNASEDVKGFNLPLSHTNSNGSLNGDDSQESNGLHQMQQQQTSVLVNHSFKQELSPEGYSVLPQSTNTSAIVMNSNYAASSSSLSSTSST